VGKGTVKQARAASLQGSEHGAGGTWEGRGGKEGGMEGREGGCLGTYLAPQLLQEKVRDGVCAHLLSVV
jgi:hypothetical protein